MKTYHLKKQIAKKNNEGSSYSDYGDPLPFQAQIWPASGGVQAEIYGERLSYVLNMICEQIDVKENDGVCVYVDTAENPDYRVMSIRMYDDQIFPHMECELIKI